MADAVERLWAVVPAGGAGTRLWPLSRADSPKFLHDLTGSGRTLLQATVDRLLPLVGERILVVTGAAHQAAVRRQLPGLAAAQVIAEPSPRATTVGRKQFRLTPASVAAAHAAGLSLASTLGRLYLDRHWASDAVAGIALGVSVAAACAALYEVADSRVAI